MSSDYTWLITEDHLFNAYGDRNDKGVMGPSGTDLDAADLINDPKAEKFRVYDDDGELYYEGLIVGSYDGYEPLDYFAGPNAGCTDIKYLEHGKWMSL